MLVDRSPSDDIVAYVEAVQPLHGDLQRALTQAAGYALLVMTRRQRLTFLDAPVISARDAVAAARAQLDGVFTPARARWHYDHIVAASAVIGFALELLETCLRPSAGDELRAELTRALRVATDHLRAASKLLPGFELVDLSQACCAAHAVRPPLICAHAGG